MYYKVRFVLKNKEGEIYTPIFFTEFNPAEHDPNIEDYFKNAKDMGLEIVSRTVKVVTWEEYINGY